MSGKKDLTRAELARQRRARRAAEELSKTVKRAVKPVVAPAARRPVAPQPSVRQPLFVQTRRQRRFQAALGLPQIHLQRETLRAHQPDRKWRAVSLILSVVFGLALLLGLTLPYFNIPSVTVLGNSLLTREEISEATGALGRSIFTVQTEEVELRLRLAYPELLSAKAEIYLPNHLYVTVQERQPAILWEQDGAYTWVDANGVAFRPRGVVEGLIPVTGLSSPPPGPSDSPLTPPAFMQKTLADSILALAPQVPAGTAMTYHKDYGLGWQDPRGWKVFFGTEPRHMALKLRVYESLVASLQGRGVQPTFINIAYPQAPYYRAAADAEYKPATGNGY